MAGSYRSVLNATPATVELLRPYNSLPALLGLLAGWSCASQTWHWSLLYTAGGILLLVHSAANLQNDLCDQAIDRLNHRQGPLLDGRLPSDTARTIVAGLYGLAVVIALKQLEQPVHLVCALGLIAASWLYNAPPMQLSRRPIASISLLALCYSLLPIMYGSLLTGNRISLSVVILWVAWTASRFGLSILKDFKDVHGDRQAHKQTFYIRFGRTATVATSTLAGAIGFALLSLTVTHHTPQASTWSWLVGVALALAGSYQTWLRYRLWRTQDDSISNRLFHKSLIGQLVIEGLVVAWFTF